MISGTRSVSIVVPTYKEAANIPDLLARIGRVREQHALDLEVLIMDDDSRDGSIEAVAKVDAPWARIVVRTDNRGLSPSVTEGMRLATKDTVVVMDADLSHPPEKIPELLDALDRGADFVIGSRYVEGGSTDHDWGFFRWLNSRIATLLAWPLTSADDPMSGFFAVRRHRLEGATLNAVGYKIGLEVIVKCGLKLVMEVPIHFSDRTKGTSKLTLKQQLLYIRHLRRLYIHKFTAFSEIVQFGAVGLSGVVVNLAVLSALVGLGVEEQAAVAGAIGVSILSNFVLNRRFTFDYARADNIWKQLAGFIGACALGAVANYFVTLATRDAFPHLPLWVAALVGVGAGLVFNFAFNRFFVFKKKFYRAKDAQLPIDVAGGPPAVKPKADLKR